MASHKKKLPKIIKGLLSIDRGVTRVAEGFLVLIFSAFVTLSFFQVILRYVFSDTLAWADEFSRYAFIWSMFIGAALVVGKGSHIVITLVTDQLPKALEPVWHVLDLIVAIIIAVLIFVYGLKIINLGWNTLTPATDIPIAYYQLIFIVFSVITIFRAIIELLSSYYKIEHPNPIENIQVD